MSADDRRPGVRKPINEESGVINDERELRVIVPSRGRPENIARLMEAWRETQSGAGLTVVVDEDDPCLLEYIEICQGPVGLWMDEFADDAGDLLHVAHLRQAREGWPESGFDDLMIVPAGRRMVSAVNRAASLTVTPLTLTPPFCGFMGDDHVPRALNWDAHLTRNLRQLGPVGIVYGNDLVQGPALPTAVFMTSNIPRALGYMIPPGLRHLYADNTWLTWGRKLDRIRYLPDVVIEHVHPIAGKAQWDDTYAAANSGATYEHDAIEFDRYCAHDLEDDLRKLKELM